MRLQDMAAGYYEAAQRIQKQIDRLKRESRSLERDIRILRLQETKEDVEKTAETCARYYEKGFSYEDGWGPQPHPPWEVGKRK